MSTVGEVTLAKAVPPGLVEELVKKSVYCSADLLRLEVQDSGKTLRFWAETEALLPEVEDKLVRFVADLVRGYRHFDHKIVYRSQSQSSFTAEVWPELLRRGWVFDLGLGQVALRGPILGLYEYFEAGAKRIALQQFKADPHHFPALISTNTLARCGYFRSFPHAITFTTHLREDFDLIQEFSAANQNSDTLTVPRPDAMQEPRYCLTPLVCYHCYETLQGHVLGGEETRILTALGPCFRYESRNITSLERLWNFHMREIVYVGSQARVKQLRQQCMDIVGEWLDRLELQAHFETASDPFFTNDFSEKTYFQLLSDLKYELRLNVSAEKTIAAGSFNLHNDFFGKVFDIRCGETRAFTSCVGFGLERLAYAFLCQKGFDPARWPAEVQKFLEL